MNFLKDEFYREKSKEFSQKMPGKAIKYGQKNRNSQIRVIFFFFFHCLQGCKEQYFFRNTSFPKENWNNLLYSTQEIRVCVGLFSIRRQLQRWTNMIPRKRRAASLISKPQTKNQYEENYPEMNSVSFLWSYPVAKFKI